MLLPRFTNTRTEFDFPGKKVNIYSSDGRLLYVRNIFSERPEYFEEAFKCTIIQNLNRQLERDIFPVTDRLHAGVALARRVRNSSLVYLLINGDKAAIRKYQCPEGIEDFNEKVEKFIESLNDVSEDAVCITDPELINQYVERWMVDRKN